MFSNPSDETIKDLLRGCRTVAVVGLSQKPERDSYKVARYLKECGYRVIPVNPALKDEVLGEKPYPALAAVPVPVDIVDVFRRGEEAPGVVEEALPLKPKAVWLQLGVVNEEAAKRAAAEGVTVVMDRCMKIEHGRLLGDGKVGGS
ncbi:MAG: CoA-binding protein [Peptococcaceae bacterium]|nr:MAG: CoA-binding protein [Peptococcaceae bacterium]